jgi:hypothetical protein
MHSRLKILQSLKLLTSCYPYIYRELEHHDSRRRGCPGALALCESSTVHITLITLSNTTHDTNLYTPAEALPSFPVRLAWPPLQRAIFPTSLRWSRLSRRGIPALWLSQQLARCRFFCLGRLATALTPAGRLGAGQTRADSDSRRSTCLGVSESAHEA